MTSLSGGACDVIADRAEQRGLPRPELHESTRLRLAGIVSSLGHVQNPLDVTGAGVTNPALLVQATAALAADPAVAFVAVVGGRPPPGPMPALGRALQVAGTLGAYVATVSSALDPETDAALHGASLLYLPSIRDAVTAVAKVSWWGLRLAQLDRNRRGDHQPPRSPQSGLTSASAPSEVAVRNLLQSNGIPVVPAESVTTASECQAAAAGFAAPAAMKIVSADIAHKSDIGGVKLGVRGDADVAAAFNAILASAADLQPRPPIDGVLVAPMRSDGVELIVGVTRDPEWGPVLAIGFGGIFVEIFGEVTLSRLPATTYDVERAIRGLRAAPLRQGARGRPPHGLTALAGVVAAIAEPANSLGDRLQTLEINPCGEPGGFPAPAVNGAGANGKPIGWHRSVEHLLGSRGQVVATVAPRGTAGQPTVMRGNLWLPPICTAFKLK